MAARSKQNNDDPAEQIDEAPAPVEEPPVVPLEEQRDPIEEADPGPTYPGFVRVFNHETGGVGDVPGDLVPWWSAKGWTTDPTPPEPTESLED